jgi:pimeloyl-ACP methyl ester carboxylesterase
VALRYATTHPRHTSCLLLQGVYTGTVAEHQAVFSPNEMHSGTGDAVVVEEAQVLLISFIADALRHSALDPRDGDYMTAARRCLHHDPLFLHECLRDYVLSFSEVSPGEMTKSHQRYLEGVDKTKPSDHAECQEGEWTTFVVPQQPCSCEHHERRTCCIERAHRLLALWSLYENLMTYPNSRGYFLSKMRRAADRTTAYRASHKDITGALMQLFLFPKMMKRTPPLSDATALRSVLWGKQSEAWVIQGDADEVCPAAAARDLYDACCAAASSSHAFNRNTERGTSGAAKQPSAQAKGNPNVHMIRVAEASHESADGGAMQRAILTAASEMAEASLRMWLQ